VTDEWLVNRVLRICQDKRNLMLGEEADASHELRTPISVMRPNAERPGENLARRVNTASETLSRTPVELFRPSP